MRTVVAALGVAVVIFVLASTGCGGGSTPPPPQNAAPTISSFNPSNAQAGTSSITLTVNGAGFVAGATVQYNSTAKAATIAAVNQLSFVVDASELSGAGTATVTVTVPPPGGGSASATLTIAPPAAPVVSSVSPANFPAGSTPSTMTVTGSNFVRASVVRWNGAARSTTYVSNTTLTAALTSGDVAAGGYIPVSVTTPAPGGGDSSEVQVAVQNPAPAIQSLSPTTAQAGTAGFSLTVNGTGFVAGMTAKVGGVSRPVTVVSSSQASIALDCSDLADAGTTSVALVVPAPGGGTASSTLTVSAPAAPMVAVVSPAAIISGTTAPTIDVTGMNFVRASAVHWNGLARATTYVSNTELSAKLVAGDSDNVGAASITVSTPAPGGGVSAAQTVTVQNPRPVIQSMTPQAAEVGSGAFTVTITGQDFRPGALVLWNNISRVTTVVSSSEVQANVLASDLSIGALVRVTVVNPDPNAGQSDPVQFTVNNIVPTLTSVLPTSMLAGTARFYGRLDLTGSGFAPGATVLVGGVGAFNDFPNTLTPTSYSVATGWDAVATVGQKAVTIVNPVPGGSASNAIMLDVVPAGLGVNTTEVALRVLGISPTARYLATSSGLYDTCIGASGCTPGLVLGVAYPQMSANGRYGLLNQPLTGNPLLGVYGTRYSLVDTCFGAPAGCTQSTVQIRDFDGTNTQGLISADGRYALLRGAPPHLGAGRLFLEDTCVGAPPGCQATETAIAPPPAISSYDVKEADMSLDARYVAFVVNVTSAPPGISRFVADTCISAAPGCAPTTVTVPAGNAGSTIWDVHISGDGRYVVFYDYAPSPGINAVITLADLCTGVSSCTVSTTDIGHVYFGGGLTENALIGVSTGGRFLWYMAGNSDASPNDTNNDNDLFVHDTCNGAPSGCVPGVSRLTLTSAGEQIFNVDWAGVSRDGSGFVYSQAIAPSNPTYVFRYAANPLAQ